MRSGPWQLLPLLLLAGCGPATARSLRVSDDTGLQLAVASARPGDSITLAPGVYSSLLIHDREIEGPPVTLTGKEARIQSVSIVKSRGWVLDGLVVGGAFQTRNRVIFIQHSSDIAVRRSLIHGLNVNNDPWDDGGAGIGLRFAQRIEIIGNRFRDLNMGFVAGSSSDVRFEGNSIAFVREGSNWVAVKGANIRCNRFSHIYPNLLRKEHPDAIQGWFNKDGPNQDMLMEGNVILTGGPRAVQGFFLAGSYKPEGDPKNRQRNITIRDNVYYGSSRHGISISGVENVVIERNTILPSPHAQQSNPPPRSPDGRRSSALVPRITVIGDVSTGQVAGNIAPAIVTPPSVEQANNAKVGRDRGGSSRGMAWQKVFPRPPAGDDPALADFAAKGEVGARLVCGTLLPPPIERPSGLDSGPAPEPAT